MNDPLRFALIGCGRISQVHLTVLQRDSGTELVGVCDVDAAAAEGAAEAYGGKAFTDVATLLAETSPDAAVLCTPPSTHRELATQLLEAGVHVLCEKPLAISEDDARAMLAAAEAADRRLMMASKFRYVGDVIKARAILQSGILGEVISFENEFCAHVPMENRWNSDPAVSGGGVLMDNGTHSVDIVRYLLGPIDAVLAIEGKRFQKIDVEDSCRLFCRSRSGAIASIDLSWSITKQQPHFISVYGTEGMLQVGWQGSRYRQSDKLDWVEFGAGYDKFQAVGDQLRNFVEVIRGESAPLIGDEAALESVRVIQSAYRSAAEDHWEKVHP